MGARSRADRFALMTDPDYRPQCVCSLSLPTLPSLPTFICFACSCVAMVNVSNAARDERRIREPPVAYLGFILGPVFHRYREGYRFAKLACDLVRALFIGKPGESLHLDGTGSVWTEPIASTIDSIGRPFRTAIETGDLTFAC